MGTDRTPREEEAFTKQGPRPPRDATLGLRRVGVQLMSHIVSLEQENPSVRAGPVYEAR